MELVNLTPHDINLVDENLTSIRTFSSSGIVRIEEKMENAALMHLLDGTAVNFKSSKLAGIYGLPEASENTYYIVSMVVATALKGKRFDLVYPEVVRNDKGVIIGCKGFILPA